MGAIEHTIASLSTPPGEAGIAVIRVSGADALLILSKIFRTAGGASVAPGRWAHRKLYHGFIVSGGREALDEVVGAVMRGPDSYTGEDVVEISCHGSPLIVEAILELLFSNGAKAAEAGEFTKRAFLNGKMDLTQAEAVCDLIHARSELQRKVAQRQLEGALSRRINALADETVSLLGTVEASIDFAEEDIEPLDRTGAREGLNGQRRETEDLLAGSSFSRPFREGIRVAIAGPVNAGKSSIFNMIVGEQRAIVTEIPGTTRDVLREPVGIGGLLFLIQDTAGLREKAGDSIEAIGVELAKDTTTAADIVLFVIDGSEAPSADAASALKQLPRDRTIIVVNKIDLPAAFSDHDHHAWFPEFYSVRLSARTGEGTDILKARLLECACTDELSRIARERVVLNSRHIGLLQSARRQCATIIDLLERGEGLEILAVEIRELLQHYESMTGRKYSDDLLDSIFSRFCIGK
ncbi:MAG: tRNA uridine-5-carboxymethylaminomethyl(34) synthesis GTPase MnmE [Chitinivibrionia bacterium]|nr:tRNA uridine-5-carboxymethylaminomethyl(34) synthesis GTPase MnmE [Chitinivibrionia bacterium]